MLRKLHSLKSFEVHGRDAKLGKVEDFYFDQRQFVVRYLVLDTGSWLNQEETLISTHAIDTIDYDDKKIMVDLTKDQLEDSPSIKKNEPISKVKEQEVIDYFGWPDYWTKTHSSDSELIHAGISERKKLLDFKVLEKEKEAKEKAEIAKTNLRSVEEVRGYKIHAKDENFGHLEDFFVEEEDSWIIRYILVDTGRKIKGKKSVLIAPDWIHSISWENKEIFVDKDKEEIAAAPKYEEEKSKNTISKSYEEILYDHYDEDKYW